jgi:Panthothenate kinase
MTLQDIVQTIVDKAQGRDRFIVAIAGPPGSGKSTLADALREALTRQDETAEVLPMDGFHMDNAVLEARGLLPRKGAPETFDVRGLIDILQAVRAAKEEVLVPVFDRSREIAIASARPISPGTHVVLAEGNYLLVDQEPWSRASPLFDLTILLAPPEPVLRERLRARWVHYGLDEAGITWKLDGNDLPNGRFVLEHSRMPDIRIETF